LADLKDLHLTLPAGQFSFCKQEVTGSIPVGSIEESPADRDFGG
jgi:hypothetical protein